MKWVLVPPVLTDEMLDAGINEDTREEGWTAMLSAVPPIPDSVLAEMVERGFAAQQSASSPVVEIILRAALGIDRAAADEGERHG